MNPIRIRGLVLGTVLVVTGCFPPGVTSVADSSPPEDKYQRVWLPRHKTWIGSYPRFHVTERITPPAALDCRLCGIGKSVFIDDVVPIDPTDEWRVTHVIGENYLIQSKSYTRRLCKHLGSKSEYTGLAHDGPIGCLLSAGFSIFIRADGTIFGGWQVLPNQIGTGLTYSLARRPGDNARAGWPTGVVFEQQNSGSGLAK